MRKFTLDNRGVKCPDATRLGFSKSIVKRGDIVVFRVLFCPHGEDRELDTYYQSVGRSLGRISSCDTPVGQPGAKDCIGWLCLIVPSLAFDHCAIRWVDPKYVTEVRACPTALPQRFFSAEIETLPYESNNLLGAKQKANNESALKLAKYIDEGHWAEPYPKETL
jgi:hypothetical protein